MNDAEIAALALVRGGQQMIGILRIHDDVGAAGVIVHLDEALRPGLAAVGGLEEAAIAAAFPERPLRGHVDHVGIARIDHDAGDVLGGFQADVAEGAAAIFALVNAIAVRRGALAVVLAGAHPDDGGILRDRW